MYNLQNAKSAENNISSSLNKISEWMIQSSDLKDNDDLSLQNGIAGKSLFLYHTGKLLGKEKDLYFSRSFFEKSLKLLFKKNNLSMNRDTLHGKLGLLWLYQYYINNHFVNISSENTQLLILFDSFAKKGIDSEREKKNYDLLYGLLGYGIYFLERNKFTTQTENLNEIVDILEEIAVIKEYGIAWEDQLGSSINKDKELINLGFAHGIPSIMVFLAYVYKATRNEKCLNLIHQTISFLKHHELKKSEGSSFSFYVLEDKPYNYPSRLAWCYGDLGVGYSILKAGILTLNNNYIEYGKRIITNLTHKTIQDETTKVKDAGFCHGSSGIAHMLNRSFKYTNEKRIHEASKYWINETLKMQNDDGSFSKYHRLKNKYVFTKDDSLIEGSAGIGLSLLSYLAPNANDLYWDLCFLL